MRRWIITGAIVDPDARRIEHCGFVDEKAALAFSQ
jgi:hypothetical protein